MSEIAKAASNLKASIRKENTLKERVRRGSDGYVKQRRGKTSILQSGVSKRKKTKQVTSESIGETGNVAGQARGPQSED
jgi:hypothetical protein